MRFVIVPPDVILMHYASGKPMTVTDADGSNKRPEEPYSMKRWLLLYVLGDPALGKDRKDIRAVRLVRKAFENAKPGEIVEVEQDPWERVRAVIEKPSTPYNPPTIFEQFLEFCEEWCEAKEKRSDAERRRADQWPDLVPMVETPANGRAEPPKEAAPAA